MSEPTDAPRRSKFWLLLLIVCLAAGGGYWWRTYGGGAPKQAPSAKSRPLPVSVAEAKVRDVEVFLTALGTVTPQSTVTIKSRVDGQLMSVLFREGQLVKAGELLAVIDSRPFQVQLAQAEGQLKRDQAFLENARLDLKRYTDLVAQGAIARQQLDTQQSLVHQYEGAVASDKASADSSRLQITYSRITAPFAGQVGLRLVDPGNIVHATDTGGLLVVNQISPISVVFTLPEDQLPRVLDKLRAGTKLRVDAYDREQTRLLTQGELSSIDNQIDTTTGTVRLKASFANTKAELYPNQFVNAKLLVEVLHDAVVIPTAAVQRGQQGAYVYVLAEGGVVQSRPVTLGDATGDSTVISAGLAAGEKVVVEGADRLRDGAQVEVKAAPGPDKSDKTDKSDKSDTAGGDKKPADNATIAPATAAPAPDKTAKDKAATDKPSADKPGADKAAPDKPTSGKPEMARPGAENTGKTDKGGKPAFVKSDAVDAMLAKPEAMPAHLSKPKAPKAPAAKTAGATPPAKPDEPTPPTQTEAPAAE